MKARISRQHLETLAFGAIVLAMAMWRFGATVADPDLWGHVKFGIDKIESGFRLNGDMYSYLGEGTVWFKPEWAGEVVFNHEWLGEVVMAGLFLWAGTSSLVVFKALVAAAVVVFLTRWLFREGIAPVRVALVMLLNVVLLTPTLGTFRPQIFTVALLVALLAVLVDYSRKPSWRIWLLPPLFLLWVNLHGGFLSGMAVALAWAAAYVVTRRDGRGWAVLASLGMSLAALLINPNGLTHIRFLLETTTEARPEIVEWAPVDLLGFLGIVYLAMVLVLGVGLFRARRKLDLSLVLPLAGLLVAPLIAGRHLQLFVPGVTILGAPYLARALDMGGGLEVGSERPSRTAGLVLLTIAIIACILSIGRVAIASSCLEIDAGEFDFPVRGVDALVEAGAEGNAVVPFNWGQYIIWHLGPQVKVSGDGRRETVYSKEVHQANLDFANGEGDWDRILAMAPADLVIQATGTPGAEMMRSETGWDMVYKDRVTTVFARQGVSLVPVGDPALPEDGHGLCFP